MMEYAIGEAYRVCQQYQEAISRKIGMSYKKLSVVPSESQTNAQIERCNEFLELTSRMDPSKLNFF